MRAWSLGVLALASASEGCVRDATVGVVGDDGGGAPEASADAVDQTSIIDAAFGDVADVSSGLACSNDMRSVIDGRGHVVQKCPSDQGCAGGQCVSACDAAAANHGSLGCDFYVAAPYYARNSAEQAPCFVVIVTNGWTTDATVDVTRAGQAYDATQFGRIAVEGQPESSWAALAASGVPVGKVGVLFMGASPALQAPSACPVTPAMNDQANVSGSARGQAWHIKTSVPVNVYDVASYTPATGGGGQLVLPVTAWGKNYVAAPPPQGNKPGSSCGPQSGKVIAAVDNTTVKIVPTDNLPGGTGVAAAPNNQVTQYTLNAGEFIQWQQPSFYLTQVVTTMEMAGTTIDADQPIAFVGGNNYLCLRTSTNGGSSSGDGDDVHQFIPPVSALGWEYAPAPFTTRRNDLNDEAVLYRIVGTVNGTKLTYDPPVPGAPASLALGQLVDFEATGAFVVSSQDNKHPFFLAQMMSGCNVISGSRPPNQGNCLGSTEYVTVQQPAQFLQRYVFFTVPLFPTTTFTLTRMKSAQGFQDVDVDCLGTVTGWQPIGGSGKYEQTTVDLVRDGVGTNGCANGPHVATSNGPFGLVVWGLRFAGAYGYPAGTNVAGINAVYVPPLPR
jgi:hypothetical protein